MRRRRPTRSSPSPAAVAVAALVAFAAAGCHPRERAAASATAAFPAAAPSATNAPAITAGTTTARAATVPAGAGAATRPADDRPATVGFPILPPVADADPADRAPRTVRVPTRLRVARTDDQICVEADPTSLAEEVVSVGRGMIVGMRWEEFLHRGDGPAEPTGSGMSSGTADFGTTFLNRSLDGVPRPGERYTVVVRPEVFETDVPPQHFWSPADGRYRVLLTRELRQAVD